MRSKNEHYAVLAERHKATPTHFDAIIDLETESADG